MADSDKIENGEEKRDKNFSDKLESSHDTLSMIKELLKDETSKEIEKLGFEKNEKVAGVYGDGTTYGAGVEEDQYNVIVTGRPRKFNSSKDMDHGPNSGTVEKQIFIGAKRVESQVDFEIKGEVLHLQYRSPESGFFRGIDDNGKSFMVKERLTIPLSKAKKAVKDLFADAARREVGFLTNTKLGVEDRLDASTTSIVENLEIDMKKLTIKSLFEDELNFEKENINENFDDLSDDLGPNIEKVKKLNTQKIDDLKGDKYLLFDDEENEGDLMEVLRNADKGEVADIFRSELEKEFGVSDFNQLTPAEVNDKDRIKRVFNSIDSQVIASDEVNEITASGPAISGSAGGFKDGARSGAGGYNTKNFATANRGKKSKGGAKADAGAPFNIPVDDPFYESKAINEENKNSKYNNTSYAKSKTSKPRIDKDWNIIPEEKSINASKPYTQVVKIDTETHPLGMPFVKPNSKEEWERTSGVGKDHDKLKRMGLEESESDKKSRLLKRKIYTGEENLKEGINKRYIVTEKTSEEYEKERWQKLSLFSKFETIKEAEEMSDIFETINEDENFFLSKKELISESVVIDNIEEKVLEESKSAEETVEVEKPGSMFGTAQRFYKKDFLNENKMYILDLNSMVFVPNPNVGKG